MQSKKRKGYCKLETLKDKIFINPINQSILIGAQDTCPPCTMHYTFSDPNAIDKEKDIIVWK